MVNLVTFYSKLAFETSFVGSLFAPFFQKIELQPVGLCRVQTSLFY